MVMKKPRRREKRFERTIKLGILKMINEYNGFGNGAIMVYRNKNEAIQDIGKYIKNSPQLEFNSKKGIFELKKLRLDEHEINRLLQNNQNSNQLFFLKSGYIESVSFAIKNLSEQNFHLSIDTI